MVVPTVLATLLLALTSPLQAIQLDATELTVDETCRIAFESLRANDVQLLVDQLPTAAELKRLTGRDDAVALLAEIRETFERRFAASHRESSELIDWADARYVGVLSHDLPTSGPSASEPVTAPLEFLVAEGENLWLFGAQDALLTDRGWTFTEFISLRGRFFGAPADANKSYEQLEDAFDDAEHDKFAMKADIAKLTHDLEAALRRREEAETAHLNDKVLRDELEWRVGQLKIEAEEIHATHKAELRQRLLEVRLREVRALALNAVVDRLRTQLADVIATADVAVPSPEEAMNTTLEASANWIDGELLRREALEYVWWSQDLSVIATPALLGQIEADETLASLEDLSVREFLERIALPGHIGGIGNVVFLGLDGELEALAARLEPADESAPSGLEARLRDKIVFPRFGPDPITTIFEVASNLAGFELNLTEAIVENPRSMPGGLTTRGGMSLWTMLQLAAHSVEAEFSIEGNVLTLDASPSAEEGD